MLCRAIVRLFIFVGLIPIVQLFFEVSAFFQVVVHPSLRRQMPGVLLQSRSNFFASRKFSSRLFSVSFFCQPSSTAAEIRFFFLKIRFPYSSPKALCKVFDVADNYVPDILGFCCNYSWTILIF